MTASLPGRRPTFGLLHEASFGLQHVWCSVVLRNVGQGSGINMAPNLGPGMGGVGQSRRDFVATTLLTVRPLECEIFHGR
jgi:hypothetical protein